MANCKQCGNEEKYVPAGISKRTGRSYQAFSVCEHCKEKVQYQKSATQDNDQGKEILLELKSLHERFDSLGKWANQIDIDLQDIKDQIQAIRDNK